MKKFFVFLVVLCLLSTPVLAADWLDYVYTNEDGIRVVDVDSYNAAVAEELVLAAGLDLDVDSFWFFDDVGNPFFDNTSFEIVYAAALAELQEQNNPQEEVVDDDLFEDSFDPDTGSASLDHPVDIPADESGDENSEEDLFDSGDASVLDPDSSTSPLDPAPADEGSNLIAEDDPIPSVYTVSDLRSGSGDSLDFVSGLKALIISIFGEYTPVMTTMAVTETVDNVTTTTLIDAVAAGAAGVDYEWLAGVFLFGILLYSLLRLLGGILK